MISAIYGPQAVAPAAVNQLIEQNKNAETYENTPASQSDRVSISSDAYAVSGSINAEKTAGNGNAAGNFALRTNELLDKLTFFLNNIEEITTDFQAELKQKLKEQGVDVDTEIKLTTGGDGWPRVVGDHPDKAEIEQYFKDNPEMRDQFADIAAHTEIKRAVERHLEFAQAYEKDPEAAVEKYFSLFGMLQSQEFSMTIGGEGEDAIQAA